VLDGVVLPSGRVVVEWSGAHRSITVHDSMESFRAVHCSPYHPTSNEIVWIDHENVACECGHPLHWHLTGGKIEYCEGAANGLCVCPGMRPVEFAETIPRRIGYFGETTKAPVPEAYRFAQRAVAAGRAGSGS